MEISRYIRKVLNLIGLLTINNECKDVNEMTDDTSSKELHHEE